MFRKKKSKLGQLHRTGSDIIRQWVFWQQTADHQSAVRWYGLVCNGTCNEQNSETSRFPKRNAIKITCRKTPSHLCIVQCMVFGEWLEDGPIGRGEVAKGGCLFARTSVWQDQLNSWRWKERLEQTWHCRSISDLLLSYSVDIPPIKSMHCAISMVTTVKVRPWIGFHSPWQSS